MNERTFRASDAHKLDDPARHLWLPPADVVSLLHLQPGLVIADIGAGTGYFTLPFAQEAGSSGKVFAVDLQHEMLDLVRHKLQSPGLPTNIELLQGDATRTVLPAGSIDLVFMANIWHELDDHVATLKEVLRIIRAGGRLAILDWRSDVEPTHGPPLEHRISAHAAAKTLEQNGWGVDQSTNVGMYSYLILSRPRAHLR